MVTAFSFDNLPYPVRGDIATAYQLHWDRLSEPGSWFNGTQRVAIAREVRNALQCPFCVERKRALSPYNFPGTHSHGGDLPDAAVDAVHRIITDLRRFPSARNTPENQLLQATRGPHTRQAGGHRNATHELQS